MASCIVCEHPKRAAIDAALRRGQDGVRLLERRFSVSKSALARHRTTCLGMAKDPKPTAAPVAAAAQAPEAEPEPMVPAMPPPDAEPAPQQETRGRRARMVVVGEEANARDARGRGRGSRRQEESEPGLGSVVQLPPDNPNPTVVTEAQVREAVSVDARVDLVADLLVAGEWNGRATAKFLAGIWQVTPKTVLHYHDVAARVVAPLRGDRESRRTTSLGRWERTWRLAMATGDARGANGALAGWDKAAGVVDTRGPSVQINLATNPMFQKLMGAINEELLKHPAARADVMARVRRELAASRQFGLEGRIPTTAPAVVVADGKSTG